MRELTWLRSYFAKLQLSSVSHQEHARLQCENRTNAHRCPANGPSPWKLTNFSLTNTAASTETERSGRTVMMPHSGATSPTTTWSLRPRPPQVDHEHTAQRCR